MAYTASSLLMFDRGAIDPSGTQPDVVKNLYHYVTADTMATVEGSHYFNGAASLLNVGDLIFVTAGMGGTVVAGSFVVSANDGTNVTVTGAELAQAADVAALTDSTGGTAGATLAAVAVERTIVLPLQLADIATGDFKIALPYAFTISSVLFRTAKPASTASKLATLTASVNGTPVTGGAMALTTANQNTIGGTVAGTAITALNTGTAGQTVGVTASSVTAFAEGDGYVEFTVINTDLANTISSIAAKQAAILTSLKNAGLMA